MVKEVLMELLNEMLIANLQKSVGRVVLPTSSSDLWPSTVPHIAKVGCKSCTCKYG